MSAKNSTKMFSDLVSSKILKAGNTRPTTVYYTWS